jgi:site-specific DNA recombinase
MLFDGDGNRMTPSYAGKNGTHYRYYVSGSLITKDRTETSAGLRLPAAEIEQLVSGRVHRWLLDPGSIYKSSSARLADASIQQRLIARAADIGKCWPELPVARKRAVLAALIKRIEVKVDQIDIHLRPLRLGALLDLPATPSQGVNDDEIELLSVPVRLRRSGREIRMVINGTDPFAAKPDARLIKLLLRARRFNATLAQGEGVPFAALAEREGVSRSYFARLAPASHGKTAFRGAAGFREARRRHAVRPSRNAVLRRRAGRPLSGREARRHAVRPIAKSGRAKT